MRLLLDENLSRQLVRQLSEDFPGTAQVDEVGLRGRSDREIWDHARGNDFVLVSKDDDFRQMSFLLGAPPHVVWLSVGNAGTSAIRELLVASRDAIETFAADPEESMLILRLR